MKAKNITITTNSGFQKVVTSTGNSPTADVLEHLKVYGPENHISGHKKGYDKMVQRWGTDVKWATGYDPRPPQKVPHVRKAVKSKKPKQEINPKDYKKLLGLT